MSDTFTCTECGHEDEAEEFEPEEGSASDWICPACGAEES